jgi:hypothetical protein
MHEATQSNMLAGTGAYATLADLIALRHKAHRLAFLEIKPPPTQ